MTAFTASRHWVFRSALSEMPKKGKKNCASWPWSAGLSLITEALAAELPEEIERYKEQVMPAIIQIPGVSGNTGAGVEGVKKTVEQAVGSDILFSQE